MQTSSGQDNPESIKATRYAWFVLFMLFAVYSFNWMDRYILIIAMEAIKLDLGLSDTELGFLSGFAFSAIYSVSGLFIARWADFSNRRSIIALGLAFWSTMTALCGLGRNFVDLAITRFGVGLGESACSPPAHSLISDYFPSIKRATAFAIYSLGLYAGLALGFMAGGWLTEHYGWRIAFISAGIPGIIFAVIFRMTVREPSRGLSDGGHVDTREYTLKDTISYMASRRSFVAYMCGSAMLVFGGNSIDSWAAVFLIRVHEMSSADVGFWTGMLGSTAGLTGTLIAGFLADYLSRRNLLWYCWIASIGAGLTIPSVLLFLFAPDSKVFLFYFIGIFFNAFYMPPIIAITHHLMPARMRALSSAVLLFGYNIIGIAGGNLVTGIISDLLHPTFGTESIRYSMAITLTGTIIGISLTLYGASRLSRDFNLHAAGNTGNHD